MKIKNTADFLAIYAPLSLFTVLFFCSSQLMDQYIWDDYRSMLCFWGLEGVYLYFHFYSFRHIARISKLFPFQVVCTILDTAAVIMILELEKRMKGLAVWMALWIVVLRAFSYLYSIIYSMVKYIRK